ncbi:MAG TPA: pyrimidine reductase family protein [Mycobacteriales bacterium]|nr:pyrimidine reductase family protein [Mycobacteriales bacterium]
MRRLLPEPADLLTDEDLLAAYTPPEGVDRHVRANFVASADGAAWLDGVSGGLSSPADKGVFTVLRDLADVILVGAGTVRVEGYSYPAYPPGRRARRRQLGLAELPSFAVVSGKLDLDRTSSLFAAAPVRTVVITSAGAPPDRRAALEPVADVVVAGQDHVDLPAALDLLQQRGLRRVLCEGGPMLLGSLGTAGLLDELCLTVAPLLAGPGAGRITAGPGHHPLALRLGHVLTEDGAVFLRYLVDRSAKQG